MIIHKLGIIKYQQAYLKMQQIHNQAIEDGCNHLICCSHLPIFTIGKDDNNSWDVDVYRSDRGGSITAHSLGQSVFYFCFQVSNPILFYRKVLYSFDKFFDELLPQVRYDKTKPGYYIDNRKIASLGFRYSNGVSMHGVALNVDVDLDFHSKVNPCGLKDIIPTSLANEGVVLSIDEANSRVINSIQRVFDDI
jgi:lipoyl(octanoyl) transferase